MSDLPSLRYRQLFPWLALFRAGGLAVGWPQLGISFVAVAVLWMGMSIMGGRYPGETPQVFSTELIQFTSFETTTADEPPASVLSTVSIEPQWPYPLPALLAPWNSVVEPIEGLLPWNRQMSFGPRQPPLRMMGLVLNLAFAIVVWSLFGTAICRAAAVQIAKDRSESFPLACRYAFAKWFSALGAPSIPAGGILAVCAALVMAAWFGRLPGIGTPVLTLLSPVLFLAGLAIAGLVLVIVCGWPLMVAAMSVEDCDGFGALSRTFSFLLGRPAHAVWNAFISVVYGSLLVGLVAGVFTLALLAEAGPLSNMGVQENWAAVMRGSHLSARVLLATFAVSLFWSLVTLNYLLLRQTVDRKPFDDISAGVEEPLSRDLPIVGMPATDYRPGERDGRPVVSEAEVVAPVV